MHPLRVNCDKIYGDRLRQLANRNCYRLSRFLRASLKLLVVIVIPATSNSIQSRDPGCIFCETESHILMTLY